MNLFFAADEQALVLSLTQFDAIKKGSLPLHLGKRGNTYTQRQRRTDRHRDRHGDTDTYTDAYTDTDTDNSKLQTSVHCNNSGALTRTE